MIGRQIENSIKETIFKGKAIILIGARQVGKTTLLKKIFSGNDEVLWMNGDEPDIQKLFEDVTSTRFKAIIGQKKIIIIDEAQRIENIGLRLKLIIDALPAVQVVATGSSSFELANKVNEPLTGRKWEFRLYPLSFAELVNHHGLIEEKRLIKHRLVFGYYPDVVNNYGQEKDVLRLLSESYLYKDVLSWENIQKPEKLTRLLQALALQVGCQVSYNELGQMCSLDSKTVEKYVNVLEQTYIVFRLPSFSRNLRNELKSSRKIYFHDNGIRNAVLASFNQFETRTDTGALWENFLVSERLKKQAYTGIWANNYFWRTREQKEIDFIEDSDQKLSAFEFKWSPAQKIKSGRIFSETYGTDPIVVHSENFDDFLL